MVKHWLARVALGRTSVGNALLSGDRPNAAFESNWRRQMKVRLAIMFGVVVLWAVALEARLVFLQVVSHQEYVERARRQQLEIIEPDAGRGDIVDRNGELLAYSVEGNQVIANPKHVEDPAAEAAEICTALGDCTAEELAQLATKLGRKGSYTVVRQARYVSPDAAAGIRALIAARVKNKKPAVVSLVAESRRYYPKKELAAHVVGFVGGDGRGGAGIEARYEKVIAGSRGRVLVLVDAGAREIGSRVERAATAGDSVELTIDLRLQHIAERELEAAVRAHAAASGSVLIMDPLTGEILAQANYPSFNPNSFGAASDYERRNRAVQDTYEPGSTFKIVTASAAINEGLMSPSELIDTSPGVIRMPGRVIEEAKHHNYGVLSFEDVLIKSSNIGAVRIGQRVGSDRMLEYVRRFGFDQTLTPDYPGESRGRLPSPTFLSEGSLASMSMGYEIGVTAVQIASAASVIATGGLLLQPHVVRAFVHDGRRQAVEPKVLRRVVTPETASTMTAIMEGVTERGTAKAAAVDGYLVAGKTGTASKVVKGRYSDTDYYVSFVGFVPSRKPAFTILVVIDNPRIGSAYGGTIAAPVFKRIAEAALQQVGVAPSINPAPPIISASNRSRLPEPSGESDITITRVGGRQVMPDLTGKSLREATRVMYTLGVRFKANGDGVVTAQRPAAGEFVDPGSTGGLELRRLAGAVRGGR